jgi:hypothetical protein
MVMYIAEVSDHLPILSGMRPDRRSLVLGTEMKTWRCCCFVLP